MLTDLQMKSCTLCLLTVEGPVSEFGDFFFWNKLFFFLGLIIFFFSPVNHMNLFLIPRLNDSFTKQTGFIKIHTHSDHTDSV